MTSGYLFSFPAPMKFKSVLLSAFILYLISTLASYATFSYLGSPQSIQNPSDVGELVDGATLDPEAPKTEACPLNGAMYTKQERELWEKRRPLVVMVENSPDARPHSGISKADIVYEAVAEGGVTRFMPIFYCDAAFGSTTVAPVRSVRAYFIDWAAEYGKTPLFGHVGGANCSADKYDDGTSGPCKTDKRAQAIEQLSDIGWRYSKGNDLDQFSVGAKAYIRNESRLNRPVATEHSVEGYTEKLWAEGENRGWTNLDPEGEPWTDNFTPWKFEDEAEASKRGSVTEISHDFWEGYKQFDVRWAYDPASNTYRRFTGGEPHMDKETNQQLAVKNVIILFTKGEIAIDELKHNLYTTIGQGNALIFNNGTVTEGFWDKKSRFDRMILTDKKGKELTFVRGKIWISVVDNQTNVAY